MLLLFWASEVLHVGVTDCWKLCMGSVGDEPDSHLRNSNREDIPRASNFYAEGRILVAETRVL